MSAAVPKKKERPYVPAVGLSIASLVLGAVSLIPCIGGILGLIGLVCGLVAKSQGNRGHYATIGVILSLAGIGISVFFCAYILLYDSAIQL